MDGLLVDSITIEVEIGLRYIISVSTMCSPRVLDTRHSVQLQVLDQWSLEHVLRFSGLVVQFTLLGDPITVVPWSTHFSVTCLQGLLI